MGGREAWCSEKLSKLTNEDDRILTLNEIKEYFTSLSQEEANETARVLYLPVVFDCLNDSKSEQINLACDVLSICMSNLILGESTSKYGTLLERALSHPSYNVKIMALKELHRTAKNRESVSEINKNGSLITALIVCVGDDDLAIATQASSIIILIGKTKEGLKQLVSAHIREVMSHTIAISEIVRFRFYEVMVEIASESRECLEILLGSGLISSLVSELDLDDPLLKLNVIELLTRLGRKTHGLDYLQEEGVIHKIISKMFTMNNEPLAGLLLPGYLKFFGNVAYWRPEEIFSEYPSAINVVYNYIITPDFTIIGVAFDTLGHIASRNEGKYVLETTEEAFWAVLRSFGKQLSSLPTEHRIRALNCIESLLRVAPSDQNNRVCSLVETWFESLHSDPMELILTNAQNPFMEIRCAGLSVLQAISEQFWGQQLIQKSPGLIEFLLDRKIETAKESKEIKFEIVKALSQSSVFNENTLVRLQQFVHEGPFFVQVVTEIAIEGGS